MTREHDAVTHNLTIIQIIYYYGTIFTNTLRIIKDEVTR